MKLKGRERLAVDKDIVSLVPTVVLLGGDASCNWLMIARLWVSLTSTIDRLENLFNYGSAINSMAPLTPLCVFSFENKTSLRRLTGKMQALQFIRWRRKHPTHRRRMKSNPHHTHFLLLHRTNVRMSLNPLRMMLTHSALCMHIKSSWLPNRITQTSSRHKS
jgi:hypothetical protein